VHSAKEKDANITFNNKPLVGVATKLVEFQPPL